MNLQQFIHLSSAVSYQKDAVIVREGEPGDVMFILLTGQAGVFKNYGTPNAVQITTLNPGSFFGEMSLFLGRSRAATVVALDQAAALRVSRENAFELFRQQPDFVFSIMATLCARLEAANHVYRNASPPKKAAIKGAEKAAAKGIEQAAEEAVKSTTLFPDGHGSYTLPLDGDRTDLLDEEFYVCPICSHAFTELAVKELKMPPERVDPDMRAHYKGIEPLHYGVVTCSQCWYSAPDSLFDKGSAERDLLDDALLPYRSDLILQSGPDRDTHDVFARLYLALVCAPICFGKPQAFTGNLWNRLRQLYGDCGDEKMARYAAEQARKDYVYACENIYTEETRSSKISMTVGELHYILGDLPAARKCFYDVKSSKGAAEAIRRGAEARFNSISEQLGEQPPPEEP